MGALRGVNVGERWAYGRKLTPGGEELWSSDLTYKAWLPVDGNLAIDQSGRSQQWRAGVQFSNPAYAVLHVDGEIAIYDTAGNQRWSNGLHVDPSQLDPAGAILQRDGNLVIYDASGLAGGRAVWASQPGLSHSVINQAISWVESNVPGGSAIFAGFDWLASTYGAPFKIAINVAEGSSISDAGLADLKDATSDAQQLAPYAQAVVSMVPGIGPGVSGAISGALALAQGKTLDQVALAAVRGALPGGPLVQAAFDAGVTIAQGGDLKAIALKSLPDVASAAGLNLSQLGLPDLPDVQLPSNLSDAARALQTGLSIGAARQMQVQAGKLPASTIATPTAPGIDVAAFGASFNQAAAQLKASGVPRAQWDALSPAQQAQMRAAGFAPQGSSSGGAVAVGVVAGGGALAWWLLQQGGAAIVQRWARTLMK